MSTSEHRLGFGKKKKIEVRSWIITQHCVIMQTSFSIIICGCLHHLLMIGLLCCCWGIIADTSLLNRVICWSVTQFYIASYVKLTLHQQVWDVPESHYEYDSGSREITLYQMYMRLYLLCKQALLKCMYH